MTQPTRPIHTAGSQLVGERNFRAMNTDVRIVTTDWNQGRLLSQAEAVFHEVEARFSRFLPDSELSRLNASEGRVEVSPEMLALLLRARELYEVTGGIFEPAVLPQLESAGYDRSFERVAAEGPEAVVMAQERRSIAELVLRPGEMAVDKPPGLRLDLGGIGKGYAVDQAAAVLARAGDFLIDAGGDIYARGSAPGGGPWRIGIADPGAEDRDLEVVELAEGAIATSTIAKRRWKRGGRTLHHIIDPRTGEPADTNVLSVTVLAALTTEADVYAKTAFILGVEAGSRFLEARGVAGLFVSVDGAIFRTEGWPAG